MKLPSGRPWINLLILMSNTRSPVVPCADMRSCPSCAETRPLPGNGFRGGELQLANATLLSERARQRVQRLRELEQAVADFSKAIELDASSERAWYELGALPLHLGPVKEYQQHCRQMLQRFGNTTDVASGWRVAKACLLAPGAVDDLTIPLTLAGRAVEQDPGVWSWQVQGLTEYRAGRFPAAVDALMKADDIGRTSAPHLAAVATTWTALAMAEHQVGRTREARQLLRQATEAVESVWSGGDLGEAWNDWLICRALLREAEPLINAQPSTTRSAVVQPPRTLPLCDRRQQVA